MTDEQVTIIAHRGSHLLDITGMVRHVYDLAVQSMDNSSGFWDLEDYQQARRLAVVLGADPEQAATTRKYGQWAKEWPDPDESEVRAALGLPEAETE